MKRITHPIPADSILELSYSPHATNFALWSPVAESVVVNIYEKGNGGCAEERHRLKKNDDGTWSANVRGNLIGKFYTFEVFGKDNKHSWGETPGMFAMAVGVNGERAQVLDMNATNPEGWDSDKRPELKGFGDIIIYEMHHRDFSADEASGIKYKGKFLALTEIGTRNYDGLSTGIDHLKELGITHVHILPSYDFGSINEAQDFISQTDMRVPKQYNWGYDPVNYNVPEGSYSTNPYDPAVRIREFKQMVMALHKAGIRVVLDVVYNHVYDAGSSSFNRIFPDYFFRHKHNGALSNGSGCGNETASEMPMMRKFMVESVLYWIKEYHLDGFRFDLMGLHDIETMNAIRDAVSAVDPTIFIYGEGWAASTPALPENRLAIKDNVARMPGIAAFGNELRDALRGSWWNDKEGAFLIGKTGNEEALKFGIVGAIKHPQLNDTKVKKSIVAWAEQPTQMISYVSCHDDMCLADRLKVTLEEKYGRPAAKDELIRLQKLAETVVLTSQGVPFIWCGDEIVRDKKGVRNSYNSPDNINAIPWHLKTENKEVFDYVSALIAIRKVHPAFHMENAELVCKNLQFLPVKGVNAVAFILNGETVGDSWKTIVVAFNSREKGVRLNVPEGSYTVVCKNGIINSSGLSTFKGSSILVSPQTALIMYR